MKTNLSICLLLIVLLSATRLSAEEKRIFVWGGDINPKFTQYIVDLTQKEKPKLCYLPTASADNARNIEYWEAICGQLQIDTIVLKVWVSSSENNASFEETLLHSDAIVVGGGNTLNMLGIWNAQGISQILKKALDKGIILAGGSAGAICWFSSGISDSRPVALSRVDGLGFLQCSTCPHYSQTERKELYHKMMAERHIPSGYAFDEKAGILFENGRPVDFVSQSDSHNSYRVYMKHGKIESEKMTSRVIVGKNALAEGTYAAMCVKKKISESRDAEEHTPFFAFIQAIDAQYPNKAEAPDIEIEKIFILDNQVAGVANDAYLKSWGCYGLWYFYNHDGVWKSMGEDIGGQTLSDCEITFREKAEIIRKNAEEKFGSN